MSLSSGENKRRKIIWTVVLPGQEEEKTRRGGEKKLRRKKHYFWLSVCARLRQTPSWLAWLLPSCWLSSKIYNLKNSWEHNMSMPGQTCTNSTKRLLHTKPSIWVILVQDRRQRADVSDLLICICVRVHPNYSTFHLANGPLSSWNMFRNIRLCMCGWWTDWTSSLPGI